ncbi:MAG TPA: hypothetical protein VM124_03135 [Candidatus Limnocylindrales bacterium]|nr:hypothetical protein [Candidatus Limnocylindrales bacterium]
MYNFRERYEVGDLLSLQNRKGREVAVAGVLEYCTGNEIHQWHVLVEDRRTGAILPAAIWDMGPEEGTFYGHITMEQERAESRGEMTLIPVKELEWRVGNIANKVAKIVPIKAA